MIGASGQLWQVNREVISRPKDHKSFSALGGVQIPHSPPLLDVIRLNFQKKVLAIFVSLCYTIIVKRE